MLKASCHICGAIYSGEDAIRRASSCGKGKVPRLDYKVGITYTTFSGNQLKVVSTHIVLNGESHIRLYTVLWIHGSGKKEMNVAEMADHRMQGTRAPSGLDIIVPNTAAFRIVNTRRAGVNKQYRLHWNDNSRRDEWVSKTEVLRLLGR